MAGRIKQLIDVIIAEQARGNPAAAHFARTKLILRGINPDHFHDGSSDDPEVIRVLEELVARMGTERSVQR